ncbi:MAG TPA: ABC transporter permease [Chloroflexota bacterium]|nr:ABC transporter permease [Chloroflexota bacterium]
MGFLASVGAWLVDPRHWSGSDGIPTRVGEHALISVVIVVLACIIALPLGVGLGHIRKASFLTISIANVGRALPSLAMLALVLPLAFALGLGLGFWPTVMALVPLGIPPVLTNSFVGVKEVEADVVDAARGMGMSGWQILRQVELPIAAPLVMAGIRNSAVATVATATLGAVVASGGLGRYIVDGLATQDYDKLFVGALLVALMAIGTELGFAALERRMTRAGGERSELLRVS